GDEFLWARPALVLARPRPPCHGQPGEGTTRNCRDGAGAGRQVAAPGRLRGPVDGHGTPPFQAGGAGVGESSHVFWHSASMTPCADRRSPDRARAPSAGAALSASRGAALSPNVPVQSAGVRCTSSPDRTTRAAG